MVSPTCPCCTRPPSGRASGEHLCASHYDAFRDGMDYALGHIAKMLGKDYFAEGLHPTIAFIAASLDKMRGNAEASETWSRELHQNGNTIRGYYKRLRDKEPANG